MDNAHNKTIAKSGRAALVRLACRGVAVLLLAGAGIGAASAQHSGRDDAQQGQRPERFQLPRDEGRDPRDPRGYDARAFEARDEQRRQAQMQQEQANRNAESQRRSGRMTPDERRDLRRQINEAGMDLYPANPRR
jgi:hypothetical protein